MKILDRYLIKRFLIPTLFCVALLIFLVLMADIFDNLDDFLKNGVTLRQTLRYYLNLTPHIFVESIQWASFLGILYCLFDLNSHNELIAMKVSGLEIGAIIRPILFTGFLIGIVTFIVSDLIVPPTYRTALRIKAERIEKKKVKAERKIFEDVTYYGGSDRLYYVRKLDISKNTLDDFVILWLDQNKRAWKKTLARQAVWNGTVWELKNVNEFELAQSDQLEGQVSSFTTKVYPEIQETPADFHDAATNKLFISYRKLKHYLSKLKENGLTPHAELVELNMRLAAPWNSLVMMVFAIPFLGKTATRKSIALNVLICLLLVFLFHVSTAVTLALGKSGKLLPVLSAWSNNFIYGFGAVFFLDRANF